MRTLNVSYKSLQICGRFAGNTVKTGSKIDLKKVMFRAAGCAAKAAQCHLLLHGRVVGIPEDEAQLLLRPTSVFPYSGDRQDEIWSSNLSTKYEMMRR